jgi:curved DNA-binding protein
MPVQDHCARIGVAHTASQADLKRAYRKLARKSHPDLSKAPQAEARFKEVAEAMAQAFARFNPRPGAHSA